MDASIPIPTLCIVVPCYNEEEALPNTARTLHTLLQNLVEEGSVTSESHVCFVNDGSTDSTWMQIKRLITETHAFRGVNLSRNFGHQSALLAGLFTADADVYVSIDADLQDDERKISDMLEQYRKGNDIVYGCRNNRDTDTWFKRNTAEIFYRLRELAGCYTIRNHADFRLMSKRAVKALQQYQEVNLYIRGIIPLLGFPSEKVYYTRKSREQGKSKYPFHKMVILAWDGIVNFSETPLMLCVMIGVVGILISLGLIIWVLWLWFHGNVIHGWASQLIVVTVFSSLQFIFLGIIGLYIGKIMRETKRRPRFIVQDNYTN